MEIAINGFKIHYLDQGSGVPLIFLHGLSDDCRLWMPMISHFSKDYHVLAMDLRGHGKTDKTEQDYSVQLFGNDLYQFINKLQLGKVNLVGLSLGSAIIQQFALDHPEMVNKMILLSSFSHVDNELENTMKTLYNDLDKGGFPSFFDDAVQLVNTSEFIKTYRDVIAEVKIEAEKSNSPVVLKKVIDGLINWDITDQISKIEKPALLISGREDIFTPIYLAREIHESINGSQWVILDDVGHNLLVPDKLDDLKGVIGGFLAK